MIDEGVTAPGFELPALVDGSHQRVALDDYLGEDVVILAFYPADFNPGCDVESDLDQLDLFTMQPDVSVLAVGPDTLYAHEAFAERYDLHIPLLSDTKREAAEAYDVAYEDGLGQYLVARAVFVVDHDGEIVYAWSSRDPSSLANVDEIKDALGETGGDDTAFSRYRVGHAHYVEARRAFTKAMEEYGNSEWMMAQSDFHRARDEFEEAEEHVTSAARFVDDEVQAAHYQAAREKATALWQAADWLARSASEYSSGAGSEGQQLRDDAERPLEEARAIPEPVDPDDWPPHAPPVRDDADGRSYRVDDEDGEPATLDVDIDEGAIDDDAVDGTVDGTADAGTDSVDDDEPADAATATDDGDESDEPAEPDIDEAELAEIEAEIAANNPDEPLVDGPPEERRSVVDSPPNGDDDATGDATDDATAGGDVATGGGGVGTGGGDVAIDDGATGDVADGGDDDLDAIEEDLASPGASGQSLEPEGGEGDVELEEIAPESTSLEGIPSEEELNGSDDRDGDEADAGDGEGADDDGDAA